MSDRPKKLSSWEEQFGVLFTDPDTDTEEKLSLEEFNERYLNEIDYPRAGVDFKGRTAWLKYNGYDVTRETLVDADLPTVKLPKELLIENAPEA